MSVLDPSWAFSCVIWEHRNSCHFLDSVAGRSPTKRWPVISGPWYLPYNISPFTSYLEYGKNPCADQPHVWLPNFVYTLMWWALQRLRSLPKLLKLLLEQDFMLSKITINNVIILDQILLDLQVIWHFIMSLLWVPSVSISFFVLFVVSNLIYTNS